MPIRHAIWRVGQKPEALPETSLGKEALLEQMIVAESAILSDRWFLIGRQVRTSFGGIIDLLALNPDGQLILIELKRNQTPREVVAQALDYASWAEKLGADDIASIYDRYTNGGAIGEGFLKFFGISLDEEQLNGSHQIVIVASTLDPSTERIVGYLNERDIAINVIFFQVFQDGANQYLSRAWLIDPIETETKASAKSKTGTVGEWNGEHYVSFGHIPNHRVWDDARKYGFISGGGGSWYSVNLFSVKAGDRVWVNIPKRGYVGVGTVLGPAVPARNFEVEVDGVPHPFLDVASGDFNKQYVDDDEKCEYFVPVEWIATRPLEEAISEVGFFGNQHTLCRPRTSKWIHTVDRLKKLFPVP